MSSITIPFDGLEFDWKVLDDGRFVVRADEVCIALGWNSKDVSRIIATKVFRDYKFQDSFGQVGKPPWYLHEPGVWQLIFQSNTEVAETFQRWVFEDVLPKLRASGFYVSPTATSEQLENARKEIESLQATVNCLQENRRFTQHLKAFISENFERILPEPGKIPHTAVKSEDWYPRYKEWYNHTKHRFPGIEQLTPVELVDGLRQIIPIQDNHRTQISFAACNQLNDIWNAKLKKDFKYEASRGSENSITVCDRT